MLYTITILIIELETRKGLDVPKVRTYVFLFLLLSYPCIHARFSPFSVKLNYGYIKKRVSMSYGKGKRIFRRIGPENIKAIRVVNS